MTYARYAMAAALLVSTSVALAAKPAKPTVPAASAEAPTTPVEWKLSGTYGKWGVVCSSVNAGDCKAVQSQNYDGDTAKGRLLQALINVEEGRTFLTLTLPFGIDLRGGTVIRVDENEEQKGVFATCLPDGCQSAFELDSKLLPQFFSGKILKVGFRPLSGDKTFVVDVPLDGAKAAMAAIKK